MHQSVFRYQLHGVPLTLRWNMSKLGGALFSARTLSVLVVVVSLTGCAASAPDAGDSASETATKSATTAPTEVENNSGAGSGASASATATPVAVDCDTLLLPGAYAAFEAEGMRPIVFSMWNDSMQFMAENDGLVCEQGVPNSGQVAVFAVREMTTEQWDVKKADLISIGASETNEPVSGYLQEPEVNINVSRGGFVFGDGILHYVSSDYLAQWIR